MFGKSYRESQSEETPETTILNPLSANSPMDSDGGFNPVTEPTSQPPMSQKESKIEISESDTPESVNNVEKVSRIVTPYFIALIGLALYKEGNILIGTILIGVGLLSLLKVSTKDLGAVFQWIKGFLGFDDNQP